ncbi:hypothetical protein [Streptomyces hydrogenans]|uniref:hypothetical protein n=1 Tax=Streptomyces hydrogenans TaxID=1873719 RepID=UPI003D71784F
MASKRLTAVRNGELWPLTAGEQARVVLHAGRGCVKVVRGKSTSKVDRAIDRIFKDAEERIAAEDAAVEAERTKKIREKAAAKVAKRSESKWW